MKDRDLRFDIAKGIGMLMIIMGNSVLRGTLLYNIIYAVHIPLLFFISGYFLSEKSFGQALTTNIRRLVVPYYVTGAFIILLAPVSASIQNGSGMKDEVITWTQAVLYALGSNAGTGPQIRPVGVLWFLLALFFASTIVSSLLKRDIYGAYVVIIAAIGIISSQYFFLPFSFQTGLAATGFLLIGFEIRRHGFMEYCGIGYRIICMVVGGFCWGMSVLHTTPMNMSKNCYYNMPLGILGALGGFFAIVAFSGLLEYVPVVRSFFLFVGQNFLKILCIHSFELAVYPWEVYSNICKKIGILDWRFNAGVFVIRIVNACVLVLIWNLILKKIKQKKELKKAAKIAQNQVQLNNPAAEMKLGTIIDIKTRKPQE